MKKEELPKTIPVFPLSNFIIFPKTTVPLNIFEQRYIQMVDECMKGNRIIGIVQPKKTGNLKKPFSKCPPKEERTLKDIFCKE